MVLPAFSGRLATSDAAKRLHRRRYRSGAFGFGEFLSRFKGLFVADREDFIIDLRIEGFRNEVGTDALDFMRAGMASERSGESFGSMAMILTDGFFSLRYWPTPEMVPPVPIPAKKMSTAPSVSS